jgi:hypothetical protein
VLYWYRQNPEDQVILENQEMEAHYIPISLPKDILLKAKLLAVRRQTTVSGLLAGELEKLELRDEAYASARDRNLLNSKEGQPLGTYGELPIDRDELHER